MHENVGASFGLSLLVVAFFAIALYQPDKPPAKALVKAASEAPAVEKTAARAITTVKSPVPAKKVSRRTVGIPSSGPKGAFTAALEGEQLEDIAVRVYGTSGTVEKLWMANRDLVDRVDEPLRKGMLVRTP